MAETMMVVTKGFVAGLKDRWVFYTRGAGWRWARLAPNGQIVGASTESYGRKRACLANAQRNGCRLEYGEVKWQKVAWR